MIGGSAGNTLISDISTVAVIEAAMPTLFFAPPAAHQSALTGKARASLLASA
jgi:hypothetical protein